MAKTFRSDIVESLRKLDAFTFSLTSLVKDIKKDDRLAVIIFYAYIEVLLNFLIKEVCKHGSAFVEKRIFDEQG
jgi:hypothetical protein